MVEDQSKHSMNIKTDRTEKLMLAYGFIDQRGLPSGGLDVVYPDERPEDRIKMYRREGYTVVGVFPTAGEAKERLLAWVTNHPARLRALRRSKRKSFTS